MVGLRDRSVVDKIEVLGREDARKIVLACEQYFNGKGNYTGDRHQSEVIAQSLEEQRHYVLVDNLLSIHKIMKEIKQGNFDELKFFTDTSVSKDMMNSAKEIGYKSDVLSITGTLEKIDTVLNCRSIDWEKSKEFLSEAKREIWPASLTMVEKLDEWQKDKRKGVQL